MSRPEQLRCDACGRVLGEWAAGLLVMRHRGREVVIRAIESIRCEQCGRVWKPPDRRTVAVS